VPWWDEELTKLRRKTNKVKEELRAYKLNLSTLNINKQKYRKTRNNYVKEIRKRKRDAWRNFVTTEGNREPWSLVYKIIKNKHKKENITCSLELQDGTHTRTWNETMNALDKCMPKDIQEENTDTHQLILQEVKSYQNSNVEQEITRAEIARAIDKLKNGKAPRHVGFNTEIIKAVWKNNKKIITNILNNCFQAAAFSTDSKIAVVKMILKGENKDRQKINSYRPISLIPTMSKLYKKIIIDRITENYKDCKVKDNIVLNPRNRRKTRYYIS